VHPARKRPRSFVVHAGSYNLIRQGVFDTIPGHN
jgi:hypothetical protein